MRLSRYYGVFAAWLLAGLFFGPPAALCQTPANRAILSAIAIRNIDLVADNFYRGSQPDAEALQRLQKAGVTVDICLDDEQKYFLPESAAAQALGMKFVSIPMNALRRPTAADVSRFLSVVGEKDREPVYVHCVHGRDRTSAMVAIYRLVHDGWSADAAYEEMLDHGFRPFFKALSDAVFDMGEQLGKVGHRPTLGTIFEQLAVGRRDRLTQ